MNRPPWKDRDWLAHGGPAPEPASPLDDRQMREFFEKELVRIELECHNPRSTSRSSQSSKSTRFD